MKILAISDRPPTTSIKEILEREGDIELIFTLWDFDYSDLRELADINHIPKLWVYGNHCSGNYFDDLWIVNMHLHTYEYKWVTFWWFQWCVRYKPNPDAIMCTQEEANILMMDFPKVDIFLSHCPPRWVNDEDDITHQWFDTLREYIQIQTPKYFFHGHTLPEWDTLVTLFWETNIVYVYADKVIEISI